MYACTLQNCLSQRLMMQLQLKYTGKAGFLALNTIFCIQDGTNFVCTLRFLIAKSARTGKEGASGTDLEEFAKPNRGYFMRKIKSLAVMRGFNIVVQIRFTSRSNYQISSFMISWTKYPKFRVSFFGWWSDLYQLCQKVEKTSTT